MSTDKETLAVYAAQADEYANMIVEGPTDPTLEAFLTDLPPGAAILDLGCGPGNFAAAMRDRGFDVTAEDASPEMARIGRDRYGLDIRTADFADLAEIDGFDGVWANFSLLHAPKSEMPDHLAAIHRALRSGGLLSLGLKLGDGEARDRLGRFYSYYTDAEISGLLQDAGFTVDDRIFGAGKGLDGSVAPWIVLRARA